MKHACSLLAALLFTVLHLSAPAQAQLDGSPHGELRQALGWLDAPRDLNRELGLGYYALGAFGDIDGDGRTDLLAFRSSVNAIFPVWNTGPDEYEVGDPFGDSSSAHVRVLADVTGNGFPDLVTDHNGSPLGLLVHLNAAGTLAPWFQIDTGDRRPVMAATGELDGDVACELVVVDEDVATQADTYVLWVNWNGSTLVSSPGFPVGPDVASIAVGDLNGDGRDDVILGMLDAGQLLVLETQSDGSLVSVQTVNENAGTLTSAGDFDGDGDVDGLTAFRDGVDTALQLLRNDGGTPLVVEPPQVLVGSGSGGDLFAADWDDDGDLDVVSGGQTVRFFENLGAAVFQLAGRVPIRRGIGPPLGVTDLNGDGYLDLVDRFCVKSGNGHFEDLTSQVPGSVDFARAIDFDEDGDLDVVSRSTTVLENDGSGTFQQGSLAERFDPPPPAAYFGVHSLGDFTGDGVLDVLAKRQGVFNFTMALVRGTGPGTFEYAGPAAAVNLVVGHDQLIELPPVDLDGDDDLDVIGQEGWGENDGTGYFTVNASWDAYRFAAGDVDLDGDVDVAGSTSGMATLFRNQGTGAFQESLLSYAASGESHFVDLDADGYCEFVIGAYPPVIRVYRNVGGDFPYPPLELPTPSFTQELQLFDDFDGDGRLDILGTRPRFESLGGEATLIWRQLPGPGLAFAPPRHHYTEVRPVVRGDFDGDGDLDLLRERLIRGWRFNAGRDGKIRRAGEPPLPGGFVQPQLTAHGELVAESRLTFTVTNAPGPGWIVITDPGGGARSRTIPVNGRRCAVEVRVPAGLGGVELVARAFLLDATGRLCTSNALELRLAR